MLSSGTDPESYITGYTFVYGDYTFSVARQMSMLNYCEAPPAVASQAPSTFIERFLHLFSAKRMDRFRKLVMRALNRLFAFSSAVERTRHK